MLGINYATYFVRNVMYADALSGVCGYLASLAYEDVK